VQAIVDHHHNVDAKIPTKVRFQEPGVQNANVTDDTKEKLIQETELNNKELEATEANEKDETKENNDEETKLIGGSPKAENRENTEKEAKESNSPENKSQSPEVKKLPITP